MKCYLKHGRDTTTEELDDWGYDGPMLENCIGIHQTYGSPANVFFSSKEARDTALVLTHWDIFDENALTMRWDNGLVVVYGKYYGDWGIMQ